MKYKLTDLIDIDENQKLLDGFCDAVGIAAAIIDHEGNVLVASHWQRLCTDFHRANKESLSRCLESDTQLATELVQGRSFSLYSCRNGLTDAASPIMVDGEHVANAFVGQFLLAAPDTDFFRRQSAEYGFDEPAYLEALSEIPVVPEENLPSILAYLTTCAEMIAALGLNQLKQSQTEKELRNARSELENQNEELQEVNTALKVLLRRNEEDKKNLEKNVLTNVKQSIVPFLEKLKSSRLDEKQKTYLRIIDSQLAEIVSPFLNNLSAKFTSLTPMEIKVATLIKEGKMSKEIAEILGVAEQTILTHRSNLRTKLGLRNGKTNLRSYLMSLA